MTIDEIMHRLQVLKDGGYIWLHRNGRFYRYRNDRLQCAAIFLPDDPIRYAQSANLENIIWDRSSRSVQTLVDHFQDLDVVFPPTQVSTPTRNVRSIEL